MREKIVNSRLFDEIRANVRLQWLLVVVLGILLVSLSKTLNDAVESESNQVSQQHLMVEKLTLAANKSVDAELLGSLEQQVESKLSDIPSSASMNVAEAEALKLGENTIAKDIYSSRVTMVGSEPVTIGGNEFWQVRIQVNGRLPQKSFISFLSHFDGSNIYVRLNSLEYFPQSGDRVTAVVDYLYKRQS